MATSANTTYSPKEIEDLREALNNCKNAASELRTEGEKLLSVFSTHFNFGKDELDELLNKFPDLKVNYERLIAISKEYAQNIEKSERTQKGIAQHLHIDVSELKAVKDAFEKNNGLLNRALDLKAKGNNMSNDEFNTYLNLSKMLNLSDATMTSLLNQRTEIGTKINTLNTAQNNILQANKVLEQERAQINGELVKSTKERVESEKEYNKLVETGNAILKVGFGILKQGSDKWREIDQMATDYGRHISINAQEIKGFRENALSTFGDIAAKFGMSSKEIQEFQDKYIETTGRAIQLTKEQTETMVAVSSFAGPQATLEMVQNMDDFGGSTEAAMGYMAKGFQNATAQGLNARKFSEAYANNLKLASQYNFREGVNGIERMTMLSQRLKVNMQSIATAADKFQDVDSAIQTSAKLQVLGGTYASSFSNPLEMMSMAQTDMEGFTNKILEGFQGKAYWNEKTGTMDMSNLDKRLLREAAAALGIDYQDAYKIATQQGKLNEIDKYIDSSMSEENKTFLENKAQYNTDKQQWEITYQDKDSNQMVTSAITAMTKQQIEAARQRSTVEEGMANDIHDIYTTLSDRFGKAAQDTKSFDNTLKGLKEAWEVAIAQFINPMMDFGKNILHWLSDFGQSGGIAYGVTTALLGVFKHADIFKNLGNKAAGLVGRGASALGRGAKFVGGGVVKMLSSTVRGTIGLVGRLGSAIGRFGSGIARFNFGSLSKITSGISNLGRSVVNFGSKIGSKITSAFGRFGSGASGAATRSLSSGLTRLGIRTIGKGGVRTIARVGSLASKGLSKFGGPILTTALAGAQMLGNQAAFARKIKEANEQYGQQDLLSRMDDKNSFAEQAKAKAEARKEKRDGNAKAIGGAIGGILGGIVGSAAGPAGTIGGGIAGAAIGEAVGDKVRNAWNFFTGKPDDEQMDDKSLAQIEFENTKLGLDNIKTDDDLFKQAAIATIGIHDMMISKENTAKGLLANGEEKTTGFGDWFSGLFGFSEGGIVSEPKVGIDDANGDTALAKVAPNEMILTQEQQANLFSLAKLGIKDVSSIGSTVKSVAEVGAKTFINPIGALTSLFSSPTENLSPSRIDLNINGTLRLTGGNSSADIDMRSLLNNVQFKNQLMELINNELSKKQSGGGMVNRNSARVQRGGSQSIVHGGLS